MFYRTLHYFLERIFRPAGLMALFLIITIRGYSAEKPNIIVIMVDDLGYGDLSFNGGTDIRTPHIDQLFEKGMHFRNFYANCTVCSPTRASLMTGCYPDMAGVPGVIRTHDNNSWGYLREDLDVLPAVLKKAGYTTALIGKWHLGLASPNTPNKRGFEFFHGFLGDMMDDYLTHLRHEINYMRLNDQEIHPEGHATDLFTQWSVDYLALRKQDKKPFFLYLAYNAPHFPIQPPEEWFEKVKKREPQVSEKRAKNIAFVEHLDHGIGKVMDALESLNLDKNTLVIFTSDNGGHLPSGASNGVLRGGKQDMYEGGIKVPAVFVWPDIIQPGTVTDNLGLTMDIFVTLCEITGVSPVHQPDGISLLPVISGKTQATDDRTIYFMRREGGNYNGMCYYAARKGNLKLVQNTPFEPIQWFDMAKDPLEQSPLKGNSPECKQLQNDLAQHIRRSGTIPWQNRN